MKEPLVEAARLRLFAATRPGSIEDSIAETKSAHTSPGSSGIEVHASNHPVHRAHGCLEVSRRNAGRADELTGPVERLWDKDDLGSPVWRRMADTRRDGDARVLTARDARRGASPVNTSRWPEGKTAAAGTAGTGRADPSIASLHRRREQTGDAEEGSCLLPRCAVP